MHEKFLAMLVAGVKKLKVGDPLDEETEVGPMISEAAARRAAKWIEEAATAGAIVETGGKRGGPYLKPTVLTNTPPEMLVLSLG